VLYLVQNLKPDSAVKVQKIAAYLSAPFEVCETGASGLEIRSHAFLQESGR
jgi:hypothetical protein